MTTYFIYNNIGKAPKHSIHNKFDFSTLKRVAPSHRWDYAGLSFHKLIDTYLSSTSTYENAVVVEIDQPAEAIAFKMVQSEFIYHTKSKPVLELVLENVDWDAVKAEGELIPAMVEYQEERTRQSLNINSMVRALVKFEAASSYPVTLLGVQAALDYTDYITTLKAQVEKFRSDSKAETAKLAKERAKVKKKLMSYKAK